MCNVYLTPNGFYRREHHDGIPTNHEISLLEALSFPMKIEDDTIIEDLMSYLMLHEEVVNDTFSSHMRGFTIGPYYDAMYENGQPDNDLEYVEFGWHTDYMSNELQIWVDFSGINAQGEHFGLGLSPIHNWKHLPIKINETFEITEYITPKIRERDEKQIQINKLIDTTREMTPYDFIGGFLFELTFHGDPKNTQELVEKLSKHIELRDETSWISMEKLELKWLEKKLQVALSREDFEAAAEINKDIDYLKKKLGEQ